MKNKALTKKIIVSIAVIMILCALLVMSNSQKIIGQSGQINPKQATIDSGSWDTNKVTVYTDSNGEQVPVPKGYVVSGVSGENVVKTGLVIYEGTASVTSAPTSGSSVLSSAQATRNQWVWVPVPDVSRIYSETNGVKMAKLYDYSATGRSTHTNDNIEPSALFSYDTEFYFSRYDFQGLTRDKNNQKLQIEFEDTIESIKKYGGFYIGRYETGNIYNKVPVIRKMNTTIGGSSWYAMYNKMKYLSSNVNTKTSIIWGCLFDETVQWLVDSGNKTASQIGSDSTGWGNFKSSSFSYINTSGGTSTKSSNSPVSVPTGSSERNKANNIYDLAGNTIEWNLERRNVNARSLRGGSASGNWGVNAMTARCSDSPEHVNSWVGYRAYMYIK